NVIEEIEITLNTPIDYFLEKDMYGNYREHQNIAIKDLLFLNTTSDIWLINDDDSHILIYKDGQLIDEYMYHQFEYEANQNKHIYPHNKASGTYPHKTEQDVTPPNKKPDTKPLPPEEHTPKVRTIKTLNGTVMKDYTPVSSIQYVKSVGIIGDSVGKGAHASYNFGDYIKEKTGAKIQNLSVSSATMSEVKDNNILNQAKQLKDNELVIIQGTDDDWLYNSNAGVEVGNKLTDTKTYIGAFYKVVETVKENNPKAKIVVITPTKQAKIDDTGKVIRRDTDKNKKGYTLKTYVDSQVKATKDLVLALYNAYDDSLINPYDEKFRQSSMKDGLHPTKWGHEMMYYRIVETYHKNFD
ncbi:MAG: SGNH/GDSL hydrolase family protein, partial [Gemella sp.]